MQNLFIHFQRTYYAEVILSLFAIACFIFSLKVKKPVEELKPFSFYFGSFILLDIIGYNEIAFPTTRNYQMTLYSDYLFTIFEYMVFANVLHKTFAETIQKKTSKTVSIIFFIISVILICKDLYFDQQINYGSLFTLFSVQAVCLTILCIFYFFNLFKKPLFDSNNHPSFWIATGVTFLMLSTLPLSLFFKYYGEGDQILGIQMSTIFKLFYILLFVMIIKAHFCASSNNGSPSKLIGSDDENIYSQQCLTNS